MSLPDGISFDLAQLRGRAVRPKRWFSNNPAKSVSHSTELRLSCCWETDDGYVALFALNGEFGTEADLWVRDADGFLYGAGIATLSRIRVRRDLRPVSRNGTTRVPIGSASASAG